MRRGAVSVHGRPILRKVKRSSASGCSREPQPPSPPPRTRARPRRRPSPGTTSRSRTTATTFGLLIANPAPMKSVDEVDLGALEVRGAEGVDRRRGRRAYSISLSPSCGPRSNPSAYWKPEQPPPWIATRSTSASPTGSCAASSLNFVAALCGQGDHLRGSPSVPSDSSNRSPAIKNASRTGTCNTRISHNFPAQSVVLSAVREVACACSMRGVRFAGRAGQGRHTACA